MGAGKGKGQISNWRVWRRGGTGHGRLVVVGGGRGPACMPCARAPGLWVFGHTHCQNVLALNLRLQVHCTSTMVHGLPWSALLGGEEGVDRGTSAWWGEAGGSGAEGGRRDRKGQCQGRLAHGEFTEVQGWAPDRPIRVVLDQGCERSHCVRDTAAQTHVLSVTELIWAMSDVTETSCGKVATAGATFAARVPYAAGRTRAHPSEDPCSVRELC